jgi:hypothetical protein
MFFYYFMLFLGIRKIIEDEDLENNLTFFKEEIITRRSKFINAESGPAPMSAY